MSAPYRINTLVEMCSGETRVKGDDEQGQAVRRAAGWLEANPGRWFIVGERMEHSASNDIYFGISQTSARKAGFEVQVANNKVYARTASPDGLPLEDFVTRRVKRVDPLPRLQSDSFGWSISELRAAAETARDWLFPGVSYAAA